MASLQTVLQLFRPTEKGEGAQDDQRMSADITRGNNKSEQAMSHAGKKSKSDRDVQS